MLRWILLSFLVLQGIYAGPEENEGVKYASNCEVCKIVALELESRLDETGKSHDVLEFGYSVDDVVPKKKKAYKKSDLRLEESLENICERILKYNIHKERKDSTRFAKGMSQTFQTLHGLVNKGVKVELGIPYELWDNPSVEVTTLKSHCEHLIEQYEDVIKKWYHEEQGKISLGSYLCEQKALVHEDASCLREKGDTGDSKPVKGRPKKKIEKKQKTKDKLSNDNENSIKDEL